jgi:hypothetical protein
MRRNCFILGMLIVFLGMGQTNAGAFVFIDEIFADPASGLAGDANGDGVRSSTNDEFVELFNPSLDAIDISGWYLTDATASKRHIFAAGAVINAQSALVIFGGGEPAASRYFMEPGFRGNTES